MSKKQDLPAMPFYVGDWLKCPEVQSLRLDHQALWFKMLCFMWESVERGVFLKPSLNPYTDEEIIRMCGLDNDNSKNWLTILENNMVFSRREDGAIYCRRTVRDEENRKKWKENGGKGGNPKLLDNQKITKQDNQNTEDENENRNEDVIKDEDIINIYNLYPSRDINNSNRSTGKCSKDKLKIKKLLSEKIPLEKIMTTYLKDASETGAYIKNLSVFLNNLPDDPGEIIPQKSNIDIAIENLKARGEL